MSVQTIGDIGTSESDVTFQGMTIGTMSGGSDGVDLVISFNSAATVSAVSALIGVVSYTDTSDTPTTEPRTIIFTLNDGDGDVATAITSVEFNAVNDAPVISNLDGDVVTITENVAPASIDMGATAIIQDIDSNDFHGGSLTVSALSGDPQLGDVLAIMPSGAITVSEMDVLHLGNVIGTVSGGSNGVDLVVSLNALATSAAVSALLQSISYQNISDAPPASRLIAISLVDGGGSANGGSDTATVTTTVNVISVNDAPVIADLNGDSLAFIENASMQNVDQGSMAAISDLDSVDFGGGSLTVSITSGGAPTEDVLSVHPGGTISVVENNIHYLGTEIGSVSGGSNGDSFVVNLNTFATQVAVSALIGAVTYGNSSEAPYAGVRMITFALNDGDGIANGGIAIATATTTVNVTAINDAPTISDLHGDTLNYVEGSGAVRIDQGTTASVSDMDSVELFGGSLTVSFVGGSVASEDVLSIVPSGDLSVEGVDVSFQGIPVGAVNGGSNDIPLTVNLFASANAISASALIRAIAYTNLSNAPSTQQRTVSWTLNDGDGTTDGGVSTTTLTTAINILAVNSPPVIDHLTGDLLTYRENSGSLLIDQSVAPIISDVDSSNFAGGSLTIDISSGGVAADDLLSVRNVGVGIGQIGINDTLVTYGGVSIGTAAGGIDGTNLVVALNNFATPEAVAALLAAVTLENISENPDANPLVIVFALRDGDGADNGGYDTAFATATISITAVNDAPIISNLDGDIFSYTENSGAVAIDHGLPAMVLQIDSPDFAGGSLTASIIAGGVTAEDVLSIRPSDDIGLNGSEVLYQDIPIGSWTGGTNGVALTVSFNSSATAPAVSALLHAVAYANTSSIPSPTARQLEFVLDDGDGTANEGVATTTVSTTVNMLPVNAPPLLTNLNGDTLFYAENSALQVIDQGDAAAVIDDDSANFAGGLLVVAVNSGGMATQDILSVSTAGDIALNGTTVSHQGISIGTASGGTNGTALEIDLNGSATPTSVTALLNSITYANLSEVPTPTTRVLTFSLNDGDGTANGGVDIGTATTTISVTPVNDLPELAALNGATFTQGGNAVVIDSDVSLSDAELSLANDYAGATLAIARREGANVDDVMTFDSGGSPSFAIGAGVLQAADSSFATFSITPGALAIQFGPGSTTALVNEVIRRITYSNVGAVLPASVELEYVVTDGNSNDAQGTGSNPGTATALAIIAINHLPVLPSLTGGATYIEDGLPVSVDADALIGDVELDAANEYAGTLLTITRQGGALSEDIIGVSSSSVTIAGTSVMVGGNAVATLSQGPGSTLSLAFLAQTSSAIADQVLQAVTYASTNQSPPPSVTLSYTFHDGATQVAGTALVNITPVNDAPNITNLGGDILDYVEKSAAVSIDQGAAATIVQPDSQDFDGGSLKVTIATGGVPTEDVLSIRTTATISMSDANVRHSGTVIGTVSGGTNGAPLIISLNSSATPLAVAALLNAVSYANTADSPTIVQRVATFALNDGDGIALGGLDTSTVTTTIEVTSANDPPVFSNLDGDVVVFVENAVAQIVDQGFAATVVDTDSLDFATGFLTVTITSGGIAGQDEVSVTNTGDITVSGTTVSHFGTAIGTIAGGTNGTDLIVSLNSQAHAAAVSALLHAIAYANVSEAPSITPKVLTFALNDGDGVLDGGIAVGTATATVNITAVNDAPTVTDLNGDVVDYVEGSGVRTIDQGIVALVADVDSLNFAAGSLTVSITANGVATQDVLAVQAMEGITSNGANVMNDGIVIGTATGGSNGDNLIVTLNTAATATTVSNLIRAIGYSNTSTNPSVSPRTVTFTIKDGGDVLHGGFDTATATTTINVTAVDTPTTLSFQTGVFPTTSYGGTQDTKTRSDQATTNFGTHRTMEVDGNPDFASFVKWDVTDIPSGSTVMSASITINVINTTINTFSLYQVLQPWSESSATFNVYASGLPWQIAGAQGVLDRGSTVLGTVMAPTLGSLTINFNSAGIDVVQSWVDSPETNFGIVFQNYLNGSTDDLDFSSSNNSNALLRPKLTIGIASTRDSVVSAIRTSSLLTNPLNPFDVNNDAEVTPRDALIVVNRLNGGESEVSQTNSEVFPDVSGDGVVAPQDILLIINYLNQTSMVQREEFDAEGEGLSDVGEIQLSTSVVPLLEKVSLGVAGIFSSALQSISIIVHGAVLDDELVTGTFQQPPPNSEILGPTSTAVDESPQPENAEAIQDEIKSCEVQSNLVVISTEIPSTAHLVNATAANNRALIFAGWPARRNDDEVDFGETWNQLPES